MVKLAGFYNHDFFDSLFNNLEGEFHCKITFIRVDKYVSLTNRIKNLLD